MSTTTHPFTPEEVMALVDGELSPARAQSISAHIDHCAECQEVETSFRKTSAAMFNWAVTPVPAQLEAHVVATAMANSVLFEKLRSTIPRPIAPWSLRRSAFVLVGTAALALSVIVVTFPTLHRSRQAAYYSAEYGRQRAKRTAGMDSLIPEPSSAPLAAGDSHPVPKLYSIPDENQEQAESKMTPRSGLTLSEPMIARTVSLSISVKDFDASRTSLDAILAHHNGYAAALNVTTPQGAARTLQASLRIPASQLVAALAELKTLGRIEIETQNGEEVTQQHADLVARLKNSRETEQRLQDVLRTRTGKVKDVLEVEEEIARVRGEIEQMEAEQQTLEHRVSFATIDLKLAEEYKAQLTTPAPSVAIQLRNAIVDGFRSAFESLFALVLFFAESGPILLLWLLILAFPAWLLWRRYQRSLALGSSLRV